MPHEFPGDAWLHEDATVEGVDLTGQTFAPVECYGCTFERVSFREARLRRWVFEDCVFRDCDLSLVVLEGCSFQQTRFEGCKLLGVDWTGLSQAAFDVRFERCALDLGRFSGVSLRDRVIRACSAREVDLTGADLRGADLDGTDLRGALFEQTRLEGTDLRSARHDALDPRRNPMRGARLSRDAAVDIARACFGINAD